MDRVRCADCGEIVVYEPARVLSADGSEHRGSPLALGELLQTPVAMVVHERCYEAFSKNAATGLPRQPTEHRCSNVADASLELVTRAGRALVGQLG